MWKSRSSRKRKGMAGGVKDSEKYSRNAKEEDVFGTWRIINCVSGSSVSASGGDLEGIEGTEFILDESGDVQWKPLEDTEPLLIFSCDTFEIAKSKSPKNDTLGLTFYGSFADYTVIFEVAFSCDVMILIFDESHMIHCEKVCGPNKQIDLPYSLLSVLEDYLLTDFTVSSASGQKYDCHKLILDLSFPGMDCAKFSTFNDDLVSACLHYAYSSCLPTNMSEDTTRQAIKVSSDYPPLQSFEAMCKQYLYSIGLKQQLYSLIGEMHACGDRIIDIFYGRGTPSNSSTSSETSISPLIYSNSARSNLLEPAKLYHVINQCLRELALGIARFLLLCKLFVDKQAELSRPERHEIIKYARTRLPVFLDQITTLLHLIKDTFKNATDDEMTDITLYFFNEMIAAYNLVITFVAQGKIALEQVLRQNKASSKKPSIAEALGRKIKNALHVRELLQLQILYAKMSDFFDEMISNKEQFERFPVHAQQNMFKKFVVNCLSEVDVFLGRIPGLQMFVQDNTTPREWKHIFKVGSAKIAWVLSKISANKEPLKQPVDKLIKLVGKQEFNVCLKQLGFLDQMHVSSESGSSDRASKHATAMHILPPDHTLSTPPCGKRSELARRAIQLLKTGQHADLEFVVIPSSLGSASDLETGCKVFHGHSVIVAARCAWFRRLFASGMKEALDRSVKIHDADPGLFEIILNYIYSGQLNTKDLSVEQLAMLITLCDRFEMDELKTICEAALINIVKDPSRIADDQLIDLIAVAVQFRTPDLKGVIIQALQSKQYLLESAGFADLAPEVQGEIQEALDPTVYDCELLGYETKSDSSASDQLLEDALRQIEEAEFGSLPLTHSQQPLDNSSSDSDLEAISNVVENIHLHVHLQDNDDDNDVCASLEASRVIDETALEDCVNQLKEILGVSDGEDSPSEEELTRVAIAADMDLNRALNYYFSR